jgi:hypothetical protein
MVGCTLKHLRLKMHQLPMYMPVNKMISIKEALGLLCLLLVVSCKVVDTENTTTRIVRPTFPTIVFTGDPIISTTVGGGTFTDPGAIGYDSITSTSTPLQPIANTVDLSEPGFYSVQYETRNTWGYRSNRNRLVLVSSVPASDDISGIYRRTSNGQEVTLTKKGTGLYVINNIGGVAGNPDFVFDVYVGIPTLTTLQVPPQPNPLGGNISVQNGQVQRNGNNVSFSYVVVGSGFGTATRTFTKVL